MSSSPDSSDPVTIKTQYGKLAEDWRHINTQIWGVPAVAISIMTGLILAAYQQQLYGWPRVISLGVGALLLFALTVEVIKKRLLMSAISRRLGKLEKDNCQLEEFPFSTEDLIKDASIPNNPDERDPIYKLFRWSYARQYLTYVTFVAAILVSILTEWEFVKYFHDRQWWVGYLGIIPVIVISLIIVRLRRRQEEKWIRTDFGYKHSKPNIAGKDKEAREVKVTVNMRDTPKDKIKVNAYHNTVEVKISDSEKNYRKTSKLPPGTDIETAKSTYQNGMIEITFDKKVEKPKGKPINIQ